eukprot:3660977-Amphidinium_carterae.1
MGLRTLAADLGTEHSDVSYPPHQESVLSQCNAVVMWSCSFHVHLLLRNMTQVAGPISSENDKGADGVSSTGEDKDNLNPGIVNVVPALEEIQKQFAGEDH